MFQRKFVCLVVCVWCSKVWCLQVQSVTVTACKNGPFWRSARCVGFRSLLPGGLRYRCSRRKEQRVGHIRIRTFPEWQGLEHTPIAVAALARLERVSRQDKIYLCGTIRTSPSATPETHPTSPLWALRAWSNYLASVLTVFATIYNLLIVFNENHVVCFFKNQGF